MFRTPNPKVVKYPPKNLLGTFCLKCVELRSKIMSRFPHLHGLRDQVPPKFFFARNWLKWADLQRGKCL